MERPRTLRAALLALLVFLLPRAALAAGDAPVPVYRFVGTGGVVAVTCGVIVAAFLVNRFAAKRRRHIRSTAILGILYLLSFATTYALGALDLAGAAGIAREVTELLGVITAVNLAALTVFDLGLPAIGVELAAILTDILVGAAYIAAILVTLHRAGVQLSGILAISTLLTTVTAFSLQGTLANVVGGVALQIDDSIRVGDWVQLENGRQGKVRELRWRYTVIETRDWDTMIVPNATILSSAVTILGKREGQRLQHRMWVYFNVDFRYSPSSVIQAVNEGLQCGPIEGVAADPAPHAICFDFAKDPGASSAYYAVRYWLTDLAKDDPTSSRVRERIFSALRRAQIPLAVPASHLWIERDDLQRRERKVERETQKRLQALAGVEFLKTLHQDELDHVAGRLRYALFAPGERITRQDAVAHWLYIIVTGSAEVRVEVEGAEKTVARIDAPGFVGERGLMTGEPRSATVIAVTEVECYRLDKEAFNKIMNDRPEIAAEISPLLAQRKVELEAIRQNLDEAAKRRAMAEEHQQLLGKIQSFFGLDRDSRTVG